MEVYAVYLVDLINSNKLKTRAYMDGEISQERTMLKISRQSSTSGFFSFTVDQKSDSS